MKRLVTTVFATLACTYILFAQVVINEIIPPNMVELKNLGAVEVPAGGFWLCEFPSYDQLSNLGADCGSLTIPAGGILKVTTSNINLSAADGELGLYTVNNFASSAAIIDYVEWGSTGHQRSSVAQAAGIWVNGDFVGVWTDCSSLEYDGAGDSSTDWMTQDMPSSPCIENTLTGCAGPACDITGIGLANVACDDNGTPTDPADDIIEFSLNPTGTGLGATYGVSVSTGTVNPTTGTYGLNTQFTLNAGSAGSGNVTVTVTDVDDGSCMDAGLIIDPGSCSDECQLTSTGLSSISCDDNDTPSNPDDDRITFSLNPTGTGTGATYNVAVSVGTVDPTSGTYGQTTQFTMNSGSAGGGDIGVFVGDADDAGCDADDFVGDPGSCSDQCLLTDSGLANVSCDAAGTDFDPVDDRIVFDLNPVGMNLGLSYSVSVPVGTITPNIAAYGGPTFFTLDEGSAGNGNINITIEDIDDPSCSIDLMVDDPGTCSSCDVDGGSIATMDNTTLCLSDAMPDLVDFSLTGDIGMISQWIIAETGGNIIALPAEPPFDFSNAGPGICVIWHLSHDGPVTGLVVGSNINDLSGCLDLSNSINVDRREPKGGVISTENLTTVCAGDGNQDAVDVNLTGEMGAQMAWVVTDTFGLILALPEAPPIDFEPTGVGVCDIYHLSYESGLTGLVVGGNIANLMGCFDFSNNIRVTRFFPNAGFIMTSDPTQVCADDGVADTIDVSVMGNTGPMNGWVITSMDSVILGLPAGPPFSFEGAGAGVCKIWHMSFDGVVDGLMLGNHLEMLMGCFDLSNAITVVRDTGQDCSPCVVDGGIIATLDSSTVCVGDGIPDFINTSLSGNSGPLNAWIITDSMGVILALPEEPPFDFDGAGGGICLIWHMSYDGDITGLEIGNNIGNLMGCFSLSNFIEVTRLLLPMAGTITTTDTTVFCVDDVIDDFVDAVVAGATGSQSAWVITDDLDMVLALPPGPPFNFSGAGAGVCRIWHISFEGSLTGLVVGNDLQDVMGCYAISNFIDVTRLVEGDCPSVCIVEGGVISTTSETNICVGEGITDSVVIVRMADTGDMSSYVITDEEGVILQTVPSSNEVFTFEGAGAGTCIIYHISYDMDLTGLEPGMHIDSLDGCFDLSNSIIVVRREGNECTTSTTDIILSDRLNVFPNPSNGSFNIDFGGLEVESFKIVSTAGQTLLELYRPNDQEYIDVNPLPGLYLMVVRANEGIAVKKLIIQ